MNTDQPGLTILRPEEKKVLLAQFDRRHPTSRRNLNMCRLMVDGGLTVSEVAALRRHDFEPGPGLLRVRDPAGRIGRTLRLGPALRGAIDDWCPPPFPGRLLFPTRTGRAVDQGYLRKTLRRKAQEAGLLHWRHINPSTLRHTFAVELLRATGDLARVKRALGHDSLQSVQRYVSFLDPSETNTREAIDIRSGDSAPFRRCSCTS